MEAIGTVLAQLDPAATECSTSSLALRPIAGAPQTMAECDALAAWAEALPAPLQPKANAEQIRKHMAFLAATLPTQGHEDETGQLRFAVYASILADWSNEAIAYMCRQACRTLRWFPVPVQMLELLDQYQPPISERETTLRICSGFRDQALWQWLANVREGQPIGDVPEQWMRIGVECGVIRRLDDGSYVSRAQFVGPTMAAKYGVCL